LTERENLFRPIHKGIRAMLYGLGGRMQSIDFADSDDGTRFVAELRHELGDSLSNCILCLLRYHSRHEEKDLFSAVRVHDPDVVDLVMKEHADVSRRVRDVGKTCEQFLALRSPERRLELGDRLTQEVNDLFVAYLAHLNNEEALLVPVMWQWFSDAQLRAMRAQFYDSLPLPLFETWMRWTLPAMNLPELVVLFKGLRKDPGTARLDVWMRVGQAALGPERWNSLRERADLAGLAAASG
jgi:hypothetical protein